MTDYPLMMYKPGEGLGHMLADKPLKLDNKYEVDTVIVQNEDEEAAHLAEGWSRTPDMKKPEPAKSDPRDEEIAQLKARLEGEKRGRPKREDDL